MLKVQFYVHFLLIIGENGFTLIGRGTENIQSPEMLTLSKLLNRTSTHYDVFTIDIFSFYYRDVKNTGLIKRVTFGLLDVYAMKYGLESFSFKTLQNLMCLLYFV